jgi:hypothetical protein
MTAQFKIYGKFPTTPDDIPLGEHWAIITGSSIFVPGDQRSREAPGHGYPEHIESYLQYEAFLNADDFKSEVTRLTEKGDRNFRAVHVLPVVITHLVEVK